jgi:hypothetical protein
MNHRGSGRWVTAASAALVLALVLVGEGFFLSGNLQPGTHFLPSGTTMKVLFQTR